MNIENILKNAPLIPVIIIHKLEHALPLAKALLAGGINALEITLRTDVALEAISLIHQEYPNCIVGAGTVIHPEQFAASKAAGAKFAVSPGSNNALCAAAQQHELPYLPGACTPSEVINAIHAGYQFLKLFPANLHGGITLLKSFASIFPNIQFCPTGGIHQDNMQEYLTQPNVVSIGGTWLTRAELVNNQQWDTITKFAEQATTLLKAIHNKH